MKTLQDLRKARFHTVKAFAKAAGITPTLAGQWLRGRDDINPRPLYTLLGITNEEYLEAWQATKIEEDAKWKAKHPALSPV
jgi:transcriptional regulator with XRE-family HTH domain